jgi:hypothetical protein
VRDQVLRHNPQTGVFCGSYINEKIRFIVQDAVLDQPTDAGLLRAFTHMSLTRDPRAPTNVPQEFIDALPPNAELVELQEAKDDLFQQIKTEYTTISRAKGTEIADEYHRLLKEVKAMQKKLDREIKLEFRRDYFYRIHNEELERQLSKTKAEKYVEPVIHHQLPERTQLQEVVCDLSKDLKPENIVKRRIRAVDLLIVLSRRQEIRQEKQQLSPNDRSSLKAIVSSPEPFPLVCQKNQCIFCLGKESLSLDVRTRSFCRTSVMMDHVENHLKKRLQKYPSSSKIGCDHPVCKARGLVLKDVMHFKNHVATVHHINL